MSVVDSFVGKPIFSPPRLALLWVSIVLLLPATALAQYWRQVNVGGPSARCDHAMAYDSKRNVVILFGGSDKSNNYLNDTWHWDGHAWSVVANAGPSPRNDHALAYDSNRDVTVLFSGAISSGWANDTWEWNGINWSHRSGSGPIGREMHAMAFDKARGEVVLFGGGRTGVTWTEYNDTWVWNGSTWTQKFPSSSPDARIGHAMAYDSTRNVVVLFGGAAASTTFFNDVWEWNGSNWSKKSPSSSPSPRYMSALAYDSARRLTVLFAGRHFSGTFLNDTWEWNGTNWFQVNPSGPRTRRDHAVAYDGKHKGVVLFGGYDWTTQLVELGDTWCYGYHILIADSADYDNNGRSDISIFRPTAGKWFIRNAFSTKFGLKDDIPVPGDYDGDGDADVAVFRPSTGKWFIQNQFSVSFGLEDDIPVPADYDGDGDTDIAVFRPSAGKWFVRGGSSARFRPGPSLSLRRWSPSRWRKRPGPRRCRCGNRLR